MGIRVVVTGGGTGGHIYPALAVAQALRNDAAVAEVAYIGKTGGLESELVPAAGFAFEGIAFYGMPRQKRLDLPCQLLVWLFRLFQAANRARRLLRQYRPHVVFGTGGYVSAPVLMAAAWLRIPYVLHEPDAMPGLTNQVMGWGASAVTTSFADGATFLKRRQINPRQQIVVTGNPIRGTIGAISKADALAALGLDWPVDRPVLLVTGGSQGARRLNQAVVSALPVLLDELGWGVVHLTGKTLYAETLEALSRWYPQWNSQVGGRPAYNVQPFSAAMDALLGLASVAVCRAGSLSLSEMYVCGIPTVLVPYPYAAADHQRKNAQASVRAGASVIIEDADCTAERLVQALRQLMETPGRLATMAQAARALGQPDATARIVTCLKQFVKTT